MDPCRPAALFVAALSLSVVCTITVRGADEASWQALADGAVEAESEGRLEEAERMLLSARREAEGPGAARMLRALSIENLADFYYRAGRLAEAEPLYVHSLDLWAEILGSDQPRVGIPMHNLAVLYLDDCRVDEALPLIDAVLKLWESSLGPDHPDRVTAIRTDATLLRRCHREDEATTLERRSPAPQQ